VTSTVSGTTPLFALVAAALLLGEKIPSHAAAAALGVLIGIRSFPGIRARCADFRMSLGLAVLGAVVRALAQVGRRRRCSSGPTLRGEPIGYAVSSVTVVSATGCGARKG